MLKELIRPTLVCVALLMSVARGGGVLFAQEIATPVSDANIGVHESVTTADFLRVKQKVDELVKQYTGEKVLVVVDIDNTLLAMNQDLGSDQWFNWQDGLLENHPDSPDLVATDFSGLLDVQGTLFALSGMHTPEPDLPQLIEQIQASGVTTVVLTSRGPEFRDAAQRELKRNGFKFDDTALRIDERRGLFRPYDPKRPNAHGLSKDIINEIGDKPRAVTYANGIYMTAGQHKGYMLRTLLARAISAGSQSPSFRAIVFVDDHAKHTQAMHQAFEEMPVDVATFRYSREDGNVRNFEDSSKTHAVRDWNHLKDFIERVLVK